MPEPHHIRPHDEEGQRAMTFIELIVQRGALTDDQRQQLNERLIPELICNPVCRDIFVEQMAGAGRS